jgi:ubiquitin C-terminal hydrolase
MSDIHKLPPFGLQNNDRSCYLNSILQMLFTCDIYSDLLFTYNEIDKSYSIPAIAKLNIYTDKERLIASRKNIIKAILDYLESAQRFIKTNNSEQIERTSIPNLSTFILNQLSITNDTYLRSVSHGQQSVCEFFDILIELLGLEEAFKFVYVRSISCNSCGHNSHTEDITYCYRAFDSTVKSFNDCLVDKILGETCINDDYACEKCKKKNVFNRYWLKSIPDNIVVLFNKYDDKIDLQHPNTLSFKSIHNKKLVYKLSAQLEHEGNSDSGHYYALVKRDDKIFRCDDMQIYIMPSEISSTRNTYMALWKKSNETDIVLRQERSMLGKVYMNKYRE